MVSGSFRWFEVPQTVACVHCIAELDVLVAYRGDDLVAFRAFSTTSSSASCGWTCGWTEIGVEIVTCKSTNVGLTRDGQHMYQFVIGGVGVLHDRFWVKIAMQEVLGAQGPEHYICLVIHTDGDAARRMLHRHSCGRERYLQTRHLWYQQSLHHGVGVCAVRYRAEPGGLEHEAAGAGTYRRRQTTNIQLLSVEQAGLAIQCELAVSRGALRDHEGRTAIRQGAVGDVSV